MIEIQYSPLPHQRSFHRNPSPYRLFRGGVGSGKTLCGAAESIKLAVGNPACDGMIVAPTWGILHRTTLRAFRSLLPRRAIAHESKSERYIELKNAARIYYGSADRPDTLEGANLAWAWGDEGRYWDKEAWEILLARVREPRAKRRSIVMTSTPAMNWLYDCWGRGMEGYAEIAAPTEQNPYLPPEYIDTLRRSYSAGLYRQYVGGEWIAAEGSVFPEFDDSIHLVDGLAPPLGASVDLAVDLGIRRPAVVYLQHFERCRWHGGGECIHVVGEFHPNECHTEQLVFEVRHDLQRRGWRAGTMYIDPAGANRDVQTGRKDLEVLEAGGFQAEYSYDPVMRSVGAGIDHVRSLLKPVIGLPRLYLDASLGSPDADRRGVVAGLRRAEFDSKKNVYQKDGELDHALDALRYGVTHLISPVSRGVEVC